MLKYKTFDLKYCFETVNFFTQALAYLPCYAMFAIHKYSLRKNKSLFNFQETHGDPLSSLMQFPHTKDTNLQESSLIVCIV